MSLGRLPWTGSWQGHPTAWRPGARRRVRAVGRGGRDPRGWVSGPPRGNKMLSAAADPRIWPQRGAREPCRPSWPEEEAGNEIWGEAVFGVLLVGVDGEGILSLCIDSSTLLAICYTLVVEDEFIRRMIGL